MRCRLALGQRIDAERNPLISSSVTRWPAIPLKNFEYATPAPPNCLELIQEQRANYKYYGL